MKTVITAVLISIACPVCAAELTVPQRLILACYRVDTAAVVNLLRNGANVNTRFGNSDKAATEFLDRWTGGQPLGIASWTPLIALAGADKYPDPPTEFGDIWKDSARSAAVRRKVS